MSPGASVGARHCSTPAFARAGASKEDRAVHRAVDDKGRSQPVAPEASEEGADFPMPVRNGADEPRAALAAAARSGHLCGGAGLVNEDQTGRIKPALALAPALPRGGHVRALLLGRVRGFF